LIVLFAPAIAFPSIPDSWRVAAGEWLQRENKGWMLAGLASVMLLTQALLFVLAALRFRRGRLIL
jgi:hypothetical protein